MASEQDIRDVINTLIAEGYGEGEEGMRRIAETVLTRAEQRGISPAEVVRQNAQYTGYSHPGPAAVQAQSNPQAISAAQAAWALAQGPDDPTGGANHYFNPHVVTPSWARSMTPTGTYQNHAFYTDRPVPPRSIPGPPPALQSAMLASRRANTSPTGGNNALQAYVDQRATAKRNAVTPVMRSGVPSNLISRTNELIAAAKPSPMRKATQNAGDSAAFNPIPRGNTPIPAMDAAYDREQGVMVRPPSAVGEMPSLEATRAAFGLSPMVSASTIGKPPATRVVKSVPVSPKQSIPQSYAGQEGLVKPQPAVTRTQGLAGSVALPAGVRPSVPDVTPQSSFTPEARYIEPRNKAPEAYQGPFVPSSNIDRLPTSNGLAVAPQQTYQQPYVKPVMQAPVQVAQAPVQMPRPRPAVATQLSVSPMVAAPRPVAPAPVMRAANPLRITVSGASVTPQQQLTAIQQLQAQGLTAAQAYDALNRGNSGPRTAADRPGKSLSQSSGQAGATEHFW